MKIESSFEALTLEEIQSKIEALESRWRNSNEWFEQLPEFEKHRYSLGFIDTQMWRIRRMDQLRDEIHRRG